MIFCSWFQVQEVTSTGCIGKDLHDNQTYSFTTTESLNIGDTAIAVGTKVNDNFIVEVLSPNSILVPLAEQEVYRAAAAYLNNDPNLEEFDIIFNTCKTTIT